MPERFFHIHMPSMPNCGAATSIILFLCQPFCEAVYYVEWILHFNCFTAVRASRLACTSGIIVCKPVMITGNAGLFQSAVISKAAAARDSISRLAFHFER